ncbi:hypothetical protein P5G50_15055 [Leifsonia sp. F6_8S_P_1B]|uniref:DUF7882 domain-containing protein n=1 Tax=Leifsonia williamsii TaxID=3035919 RepID=A0ABT8KE82_9MICO|nr:hypothetical protein [Leifsonia williamsii]MDN4615769.1 hypothetical protein [Leifsonia williamsii]
MGRLIYGASQEYEFDDRTLSHVKIAIVTKLRRHESFLLNWQIPPEQGGGRMSLWISREVSMAFVFSGSRPPKLNDRWMEALLHSSQRTGGMFIMREEEAESGNFADR